MVQLPQDVVEIILEYKYGLEHAIKFRACLVELFFYGLVRRPYWLQMTAISYWLPF